MTRKVIETPYLSRPQEQPTLFISQKATNSKILTPTLHSTLQKPWNLSQPLPRPLCSSHDAAPASFSDIALIDHKKLAKKMRTWRLWTDNTERTHGTTLQKKKRRLDFYEVFKPQEKKKRKIPNPQHSYFEQQPCAHEHLKQQPEGGSWKIIL